MDFVVYVHHLSGIQLYWLHKQFIDSLNFQSSVKPLSLLSNNDEGETTISVVHKAWNDTSVQ